MLICLFALRSFSETTVPPPAPPATITLGSSVHFTLGVGGVNYNANIDFFGGSLSTGTSTGYSATFGTIDLSDNSSIELGTGVHTLNFAASDAVTWADNDLIINGWQGTPENSGTAGKIYVGSNTTGLTSDQLSKITFFGFAKGAKLLADGELVPALSGSPSISFSEATLTMNDCISATPVTDSFAVQAFNLADKFYVHAPTGFEISLTEVGTYSSTIELTPEVISGNYTTTTVYIKLTSTVSTGVNFGVVSATYLGETLDRIDVYATVHPLPTVTITPAGALCAGGTLELTASSGSSYSWSTSETTQAITVNAAGVYTVTVTDANGCIASIGESVSVSPLPVVSITPGSSLTICEGSGVTLTSSAGSSYTWTSTSGSPVGATMQAITATQGGIYTVTTTDANGCSASAGVTVVVNPKPSVSITADGPLTFCVGDVKLTASAGTSYSWTSDNASGPITSTSQDITVTESGIYTVTITTSEYGCSASVGETVTVSAPPNAGTIEGLDSVYKSFSVTLTSTGDAGGTWTTSNAAVASVDPSTGEVTGVAAGTVTISYIVQSSNPGCDPDTARVAFTVVPPSGPQPITFKIGSYIINMSGARYHSSATSINTTLPTTANSLKPYGLIHQLLREKTAPVFGIIRKGKLADEFDFEADDSLYGGGSYIIPVEYVSAQDSVTIRSWQNQGVLISRLKTDLTLDTSYTITKYTNAPKWFLDETAKDDLADLMIQSAGIGSVLKSQYYPTQPITSLNACNDILVMIHGSPSANTYTNVIDWITGKKGALWATCVTPDAFEPMVSSVGTGSKKYNFLTTGTITAIDEPTLTAPLKRMYTDDIVAQHIGSSFAGHTSGGQGAFMPIGGGTWNAGAKILNINNTAPLGQYLSTTHTSNIYGRAYDNEDNGYVFYEGGHLADKTPVAEVVAARRMFFNFSFMVANEKTANYIPHKDLSTSPISSSLAGNDINLSIGNDTTTGITYSWSASPAIGSFSNNIGSSTVYSLSSTVSVPTTIEITMYATDSCGRSVFETKSLLINPLPSDLTVVGTPSSFETCEGIASSTQTVTVEGSSLDATVDVTAPADYEITLDPNTAYSDNLSIPTTSGNLTTTSVYIRLKSGLTPGTKTGDLEFSSGSSTRTVALSGVVGTAANAGTVSSTTGVTAVCVNESIQLSSDGDGGGQWASVNDAIATIDPNGFVTGVSAGTVTMTYSVLASGGCTGVDVSELLITVIAAPNAGTITGTTEICIDGTTDLTSDGDTGGTWNTEDAVIAIVDANGIVTGISAGTVTISYTVAATSPCSVDSTSIILITITAPPNAGTITGTTEICAAGGTTALTSDGDAGGSWSSSDESIATVDASGIVTGVAAGTVTITYTVNNGVCADVTSELVITVTASPVTGTLTGTTEICIDGTANLTTDGDAGGNWSSDDTAIATVDASGLVTGISAGTVTINYAITGTGVCGTVTSTLQITVTAPPNAGTISGDAVVCVDATTTLTSDGDIGGSWSSSDESIATVDASGIVTGVAAGTVTITYTAAGSGGCANVTSELVMTVNPLPVISITPDGALTFCDGGSVKLTATAGSSYLWSTPTDNTNQDITVTTSGIYTVTVTDANGCSATIGETVTVNPLPTTTITPGGPTTFCQGGSVILTAPSGATSYLWNTGATSQSITAVASGSYTVTVTKLGCSATSIGTTVTVKPKPNAPTLNAGGPVTFCEGGNVILTASGGISYQWYKNGVLIDGATANTLNVTEGGNYQALTINDGCTSNLSNGIPVVVNTVETPVITSAGGRTTICNGSTIVLSAPLGSTSLNYQWYRDGEAIDGANSRTYQASVVGDYKVKITTAAGCESEFSNKLEITEGTVEQPLVTAADTTRFCAGSSVLLTSTSATSYQWYKDGVAINGAVSQSYAANQTGSFTVIVRNDSGCYSNPSEAIAVTVNPTPSAPTSISGATNVLIVSTQTYTAATVEGATRYNWTLPGGWTGSSTTNSITVSVKGSAGIDTIYVSVTVNGCTSPAAKLAVTSKLAPDNDKDGLSDDDDLDDDNDGILDTFENAQCNPSSSSCDTDGDGVINRFDLDSDGDGISDVLESDGKDSDNDGRADGAVSADGIPSSAGNGNTPPDTDKDGKTDPYDLDTDGDTIPDNVEGQGTYTKPSGKDTDGDGLDDAYDKDHGTYVIPVDTDKDGKPDWRDLDTDNDGIPDVDEAGPNPNTPQDTDKDGIGDWREVDSNSDRIPDGETLLIYKSSQLQTTASADGSYEMKFTIILKNNRSVPLTNITLTDDLTKTFPSPVQFTVLDYKTSGTLLKASGYNGSTSTSLLASGSTLAGFGIDSINITINLKFNGYEGVLNNLAVGTALSKWGPLTRESIDLSRSAGRAHGLPGVPTYNVAPKLNLFIPDVITPNNDGVNDRWTIIHSNTLKIGVTIFNRWGQVVFKSSDYQNDWNGVGKQNFLGQNLPHGTYYYLIDITDRSSGVKEVKKGYLTLKRDN